MDHRTEELSTTAVKIEGYISASVVRWRDLPDRILRLRPSGEAWSIKEIIGHLIDSASNNHQRFVRLQLTDRLIFPDYQQENEAWVSIEGYQDRPWNELLELWRYLNFHLSHIIRSVDPNCLDHVWAVDDETVVTLFELMADYLKHLEMHLEQIENILKDPKSGKQ
ncbi:DinB family protein [Thermodesulfobacteriota bacterium]